MVRVKEYLGLQKLKNKGEIILGALKKRKKSGL